MRITFAFPQWTGAYGWMGYFARRNSTWPPLNLALLAACCEQRAHHAQIIDGQVEGLNPDLMTARIIASRPDVVGFTATSPFFGIQLEIAEKVKAANSKIKIIMGGPHITITKAAPSCVDHLFTGECEDVLPDFLDALRRGETPPRVIAGKRPADFDDLPLPARHLLPMRRYKLGTLKGREHFTSIQTTRGCPWRCSFCASDALDTTKIFRRSPLSVLDEIRHVVRTYGITHFYIVDDVLTLYREHIEKLCDYLIDSGTRITFEGSTRANLIDEKLIVKMKKAGLVRLSFGLESVNPHVRDLMRKKVPMQHYVASNRLLNEHGIEALNSTMIGLPGDTRETIEQTIDWVAENRDIQQANLSIAVPYPGTEFHEMAVAGQHGLKLHTDDFSQYRRYGTAVTTVNGMTPQDLVDLQNEGFVRIYSKSWRWRPMYGKHGAFGFALMMFRIAKMVFARWLRSAVSTEGMAVGHAGSPKAPNG